MKNQNEPLQINKGETHLIHHVKLMHNITNQNDKNIPYIRKIKKEALQTITDKIQ